MRLLPRIWLLNSFDVVGYIHNCKNNKPLHPLIGKIKIDKAHSWAYLQVYIYGNTIKKFAKLYNVKNEVLCLKFFNTIVFLFSNGLYHVHPQCLQHSIISITSIINYVCANKKLTLRVNNNSLFLVSKILRTFRLTSRCQDYYGRSRLLWKNKHVILKQ